MPTKTVRRLILNLKPRAEAVEAFRRYCNFFEMTQTGFLERQLKAYERDLLARLSKVQRSLYLAGNLKFSDFTSEERALWDGVEDRRPSRPTALQAAACHRQLEVVS
jgi:hypothetical protein